MKTGTLLREVRKLRELAANRFRATPILSKLRNDPANVLSLAGLNPDPWQAELLRNAPARLLCLNSRQTGKSTFGAALALNTALLKPTSLTLLLSPTQRQSGELFRKTMALYRSLGKPVSPIQETVLSLELANGSRIIALPGNEEGIRGYSGVALVIIDEAARARDELHTAVRPMLATSGGRLVGLSTPFGKRGWFFDAWQGAGNWHRVTIRADECPRIPSDFLQEERGAMGPRWYAQEYECDFADAIDSVFSYQDIHGALSGDVQPLFGSVV